MSPQSIRGVRERYFLSQRNFALLLGWSEATVFRYESGTSAPDEAHRQLLRLLQEPVNMATLFRQNEQRLPEGTRRRLHDRLRSLLADTGADSLLRTVSLSALLRRPSVYTGHTAFSPEALMGMMLYFASHDGSMFKTKLNKLLWYADFTYYRYHGRSVSGSAYVRLPHGPVPDDYDLFVSCLRKRGAVEIREVYFPNGSGERIEARTQPETAHLPAGSGAVLGAVSRYFQRFTSKTIRDLSHEEDAYKSTAPGDEISYEYASRLRVDIPVPGLEC